ncbi:MAG: NCS2 family permease [Acidobacteria bacterium]|nr:NCS2 family permease [Acidobacteriota bacterium]
MLEKIFKLKVHNTTVWQEALGGIITFLTMAYIIFVQPNVLGLAPSNVAGEPNMNSGAIMMATCLSAALATFLMAFLANFPIALAPGMGENFLFLTVAGMTVGGATLGWQGALTAVLFSGVIFLVLSFFKVREKIINSIPDSLKHAIAVGIGLFISFLGLVWSGIIRKPATGGIIEIGNFKQPAVLLSVFGLIIIAGFMSRKIKGGILLGMLAATVVGIIFNIIEYHGITSSPPSMAPTLFKFDFSLFLTLDFIVIAIIFLFMDMFDTVGTLIGVTSQAGLIDKNGNIPRCGRALLSDAVGTVSGSMMGTSTVTSFIESSAGIAAGARTGLASVVTGLLFVAAIFFSPLVSTVGGGVITDSGVLYPITGPVMIIVGCMMMKGVTKIKWDDFDDAIPAFLIIIGMPLTFTIHNGIALGFIAYPILKLFAGKGKEVSLLSYILGLLFLAYFIIRQIIVL